jgi:uncharacterized cofD-like protein
MTTVAGPKVVALGGGHGLAASLAALRPLASSLTAVVTVADDGGSSGRLRTEFGSLPPGDLRMALASLAADDEWGLMWKALLQHRFGSAGDLDGHAVGNLIMVALWQLTGDLAEGLDWLGRLVGAQGRVLPMAVEPLEVEAQITRVVEGCEWHTTIRGQSRVAIAKGRVDQITLSPADAHAHPAALAAMGEADWVVLGPGSWYTSVIPHLLIPELASAIARPSLKRMVTLNLTQQLGETAGYSAQDHLAVLRHYAPELAFDVVVADPTAVDEPGELASLAASFGARLLMRDVRAGAGTAQHDPLALAGAYREAFEDQG